MRKNIFFICMTLVIITTLIVISKSSNDDSIVGLSPEKVSGQLLTDIFSLPYQTTMDAHNILFYEDSSLNDLERANYIVRDGVFRKYFLDSGYKNFYFGTYNLIHHTYVLKNPADIVLESINIDMRDTSTEDTKTCFFTVTYQLVYLDSDKAPLTLSTDGEMSLKYVEDTWLINHINLRLKQLHQ